MSDDIYHPICPYSDTCHFFNISNPTPHTEQLQERFCRRAFWACEIFTAHKSGQTITITMTPENK